MTNREAAEILESIIKDLSSVRGSDYSGVLALKKAISALEKQIPKKPIRIDKNKEFDGNWIKICPLCGRMLIERITTSEESFPRYYNYTDHCCCGQVIDWEVNDE